MIQFQNEIADFRRGCNLTSLIAPHSAARLDLTDARRTINAHAYASHTQRHLNTHACIHLQHAKGFQNHNWTRWQSRLLDRTTRWLIRQDIPPAYVWVRETAPRKGPHLHVLLHLPDYHTQRRPLMQFIQQTAFDPDDLLQLPPPHAPVEITGGKYGMRTHHMRAGALRYLLKSVSPTATYRCSVNGYETVNVAAALGICPSDAPPISGLRASASHSIGATERRAAGWHEMTDLDHLRRYLNP